MEIKHNAQTFYPQYFRQPVFCVLNSNRLMLQWYLQKTLEQFALNSTVRIKPPVRRLSWPRSSRLNLDLLLSQYSFQWQRKSVLDMTVIICALWKAFTCTKSQNLTLKRYKFVALGLKKILNLDYEDIFSFTYTHKVHKAGQHWTVTQLSHGDQVILIPGQSKCYL